MLTKLVNALFRRPKEWSEEEKKTAFDHAFKVMEGGDLHAAAEAYKEALKLDPYHVGALNNLGVCLVEIGKGAEARAAFDLAYSLDDSYVPGIVNHARMCIEQGRSGDALAFLRQAKVCAPEFVHTDSVYASLCLKIGDAVTARHFQKRAWLANFDKMRYANCYLFYSSYCDIDEKELAAEHAFWADTVRPIDPAQKHQKTIPEPIIEGDEDARKIRIGYWSPDLKNHSVRYFFRPLLENHDQSKFDIFVYHDGPDRDQQTDIIEKACTHFHDVYSLSDADVHGLIASHRLDVLVELAGHSSYNRITLLQQRFAAIQMTGLGYPPTVGLRSLDAKVLDGHVVTPASASYYTEMPLALANSFWCFDPAEPVVEIIDPPVIRKGHVTFGCVGNLAKINERMLRCWKDILEKVPTSRLLIRSISFEDARVVEVVNERLVSWGFDMSRVDLKKPEVAEAFFGSYGEIDIILDTFPFNGGTTTCFATYMGVPVVSLAGSSLISRMGLSVLSNLGVPELAVDSNEAYVAKAVELAEDWGFLQKFRREARGLFQNASLGNGRLYAQDFENACVDILAKKKTGDLSYQSTIPVLPADELVRRLYATLSEVQSDAIERLLNYCLKHYPDHVATHLIVAQLMTSHDEAVQYLMSRLEGFPPQGQVGALLSIARWRLLHGRYDLAAEVLDRLRGTVVDNEFDRMQMRMYQACRLAHESNESICGAKRCCDVAGAQLRVLIPCDEQDRFETMLAQLKTCCLIPEEWTVIYERCDEAERVQAYEAALQSAGSDGDILIFLQKTVDIHQPWFMFEVIEALQGSDVVGMAGAKRWERLDWRADAYEFKAASYLVASTENPQALELQWLGSEPDVIVRDARILDGRVLALRPSRVRSLAFDEELVGAESLMEEEWTYRLHQNGLSLAVHRNLGVLVHPPGERDVRARTPGLMKVLDQYGFDPLRIMKDDLMMISVPVSRASDAVRVVNQLQGLA